MKATLITTTFNRAKTLDTLLRSLVALEPIEGGHEVIVVDDGSTDETPQIVAQYAKQLPLRYHFQVNQGVAVGRNVGISLSRGELLAFVADDFVLPANYLRKMVAAFERSEIHFLKPRLCLASRSRIGEVLLHLYQMNMAKSLLPNGLPRLRGPQTFIWPDGVVPFSSVTDAGGAAMMRRTLFDRVGRFRPELRAGEDTEMGFRMREHHISLFLLPNFHVPLAFPSSLWAAVKRAYTYGTHCRSITQFFPYPTLHAPMNGIAFLRELPRLFSSSHQLCLYSGSWKQHRQFYLRVLILSAAGLWGRFRSYRSPAPSRWMWKAPSQKTSVGGKA